MRKGKEEMSNKCPICGDTGGRWVTKYINCWGQPIRAMILCECMKEPIESKIDKAEMERVLLEAGRQIFPGIPHATLVKTIGEVIKKIHAQDLEDRRLIIN